MKIMQCLATAATTSALILGLSPAAMAQNAPVIFGTNWVAQAEHGGFYQAVADGTYAACGLDVTIQPGGPQVNNRALLLAGKIDYNMGGSMLDAFSAAQEGLPIITVGTAFQKEPQVILSHPGRVKSFEDLKTLDKIFISDGGVLTFWAWMMTQYARYALKPRRGKCCRR